MPYFTWKESFNTNIPEIDQQHQQIFAVLNRLYDETQKPVNKIRAQQVLNEMVEYANSHFSTEERLMAIMKYPELSVQKTQHDYYKEQMHQFVQELNEENRTEYKHILDFMKDWFLGHILQEDMKFSQTMKNNMGN